MGLNVRLTKESRQCPIYGGCRAVTMVKHFSPCGCFVFDVKISLLFYISDLGRGGGGEEEARVGAVHVLVRGQF